MLSRLASLVSLSLLLASVAGCGLYQGNGDDDCAYAGAEGAPNIAALGLRNPQTGQCEYYGGEDPYPYPCDGSCGPCPQYDPPPVPPTPTWGLCESQCSGLDEGTCLDTAGCRGIYGDGEDALPYLGCWATDMTGPVQGGSCDELDAYDCSRHDDCIAVHQTVCPPPAGADDPQLGCSPANFVRCGDEPSDQPDPGTCYGDVSCDQAPPDCPEGSMPGILDGCFTGYCIPLAQCEDEPACAAITEEASCVARPDCSALYEGIDCACDDTGCECAEWVFDSCE